MVNTVGIGSTEGTQLMDVNSNAMKLDKEGHPVVSKLNEDLLMQLASRTEGAYLHLTEPQKQSSIVLKKIDTIEKTSLIDNTYRQFRPYFYWFLGPLFLLLLADLFSWDWFTLFSKRFLRSRKAGLLFLMVLPSLVFSQSNHQQLVYEGNQLYFEKKLDKALIQFSQCLQKDPNDQVARFNLGVTYFRLQQLEAAERIFFETAAGAKDLYLKQRALYNRGVTLSQLHKLPESIEVYKQALRMNPKDKDARFNLEKSLEELRELKRKKAQQNQLQKKLDEQPPKSKKEMEQWLESLRQKEQQIQKKIQDKKRPALSQPEKDW